MTDLGTAARLRAMLTGALRGDAALSALVHHIGDETRAIPVPAIVIAQGLDTPWGSKDRPGVELRVDLIIVDRGDTDRIEAIATRVAELAATLPREGDGWESGGWMVVRQLSQRLRNGERRLTLTLRVRGWAKPAQL